MSHDHTHGSGHVHDHVHDKEGHTKLTEWMQRGANHLSDEELEEVRKIQLWDETKWQRFPDAGQWQPTGLTSEVSHGNCNAIWLKLEPGEGFDPHQHPNALHTMIVYEGQADCFWKYDGEEKVYSATMRIGGRPFVITPTEQHAIVANRGVRAVVLVINTPPDDLHHEGYAMPVFERHE